MKVIIQIYKLNSADSEAETPLFIAIRYFNINVIDKFLLDDLEYKHKNNVGDDALELAYKIFENSVIISTYMLNETNRDYLSQLLSIICKIALSIGIRS